MFVVLILSANYSIVGIQREKLSKQYEQQQQIYQVVCQIQNFLIFRFDSLQIVCSCQNTNNPDKFLEIVTNQCIEVGINEAAQYFSWLSVIFWFCAGFPQLRMNFITQSTGGLSLKSMLIWYFGDWCCVTSLFLLNAMTPQKFLGIWLTLNDSIIISQILIYGKRSSNGKSTVVSKFEKMIYTTIILVVVAVIATYFGSMFGIVQKNQQIFNTCEGEKEPLHLKAGLVLGYINMAMFSFARPIQVYENWRNKSCDGVSFEMFTCAMIADYCAGTAAVLNGISQGLGRQIPYIVNGYVPAVFETIILIQHRKYSKYNQSRRKQWQEMITLQV